MKKLITTIIVDDQKACIDVLKKDLCTYADIRVVDTYTSVNKAYEAIKTYQPSLLFLDVEMPKMSGLEFMKKLQESISWQMCVVFYSAFDKYILEALRLAAVDYLLKPYRQCELVTVIERVRTKLENSQTGLEQTLRKLLDENRKIAFYTASQLSLFKKEEILYFEYVDANWQVVLTDNAKFRLKMNTTSKDICEAGSSFVQVNPEYIINLEYLSGIENKTLRCIFYPPFKGLEIYVSRRNYSKIKNLLELL